MNDTFFGYMIVSIVCLFMGVWLGHSFTRSRKIVFYLYGTLNPPKSTRLVQYVPVKAMPPIKAEDCVYEVSL